MRASSLNSFDYSEQTAVLELSRRQILNMDRFGKPNPTSQTNYAQTAPSAAMPSTKPNSLLSPPHNLKSTACKPSGMRTSEPSDAKAATHGAAKSTTKAPPTAQ